MLGLGVNKASAIGVESAILIEKPVVTTAETLTTVGSVTATLEGSYTTGVDDPVSGVGFYFGPDANNLALVTEVTDTDGTLTSDIEGLSAETTYSYRAFATNAGGTTLGDLQSFTTAQAPAVSGSPFHVSYTDTPLVSFDFTEANGIYDFADEIPNFPSLQFSDISRVASVVDENGVNRSNVMKIQVASVGGSTSFPFAWSDSTELAATFQVVSGNVTNVYYSSYAVEFWLFIPTANSGIDEFPGFAYGSLSPTFTLNSYADSIISGYGSTDTGSWKLVSIGSEDDVDTSFGLKVDSGGQSDPSDFGFGRSANSQTDNDTPGDVIYISDVKIYRRDSTTTS